MYTFLNFDFFEGSVNPVEPVLKFPGQLNGLIFMTSNCQKNYRYFFFSWEKNFQGEYNSTQGDEPWQATPFCVKFFTGSRPSREIFG